MTHQEHTSAQLKSKCENLQNNTFENYVYQIYAILCTAYMSE